MAPVAVAENAGMAARALLIPTTHWDRAWYWPAERLRIKLIELFAAAKELWATDPAWRFHLDGQSIALRDYLEAVPEDRALLKRLGSAGRFTCGPW